MKTRAITMREKIIASAASAALVASMVVCAPSVAFATYDTGSITGTCETLNVVMGSQTDMSKFFTYQASGGDGAWHVDYKITAGDDIASINKHSGMLTATSTGQVTVTAYLTGVETPTGNKNNPCATTSVSDTITVNISSTSTYGYQGVGNTIMMTTPSVESFSGNNTDGWVNSLGTVSASDDTYYYFTIVMTNGFKDYNTPAAFAGINAGQISVTTANDVTYSLAANNQGVVTVSAVDNNTKTVTVKVAPSAISTGATLLFDTGFRGNSSTNTLGTTVEFVI